MPLRGRKKVMAQANKLASKTDSDFRKLVIKRWRAIIMRTPRDQGRAMGNWQLTQRGPTNKVLGRKGGAMRRVENLDKKMPTPIFGGKVFMTNNLPYIETLEYGGYPKNPKKETGKTKNGFSIQAPKGWVREEMKKLQMAIKKL